MTRHIDAKAFQATLAIDLPGEIDLGQAPDELMWMPPGRHTIEATREGKPVKVDVTVDETAAKKVAEAHSSYMAGVARNEEDHPYFDLNHDDQEASAHPIGFRWAGDDPQQGGIRAKVNWTDAGKRAVIGKTYRRFSPSFYLGKDGAISGAPVNMGGLVNRAAFKRIAPIVSKAVEESVIRGGGVSFFETAKIVAKARILREDTACEVLARERPDLYLEYRISLGLGDRRHNRRELAEARQAVEAREAGQNDLFLIESKALAQSLEINLVDAFDKIARTRPSIYERYRARFYGFDLTPAAVSAAMASAEESPFITTAKAIAASRHIELVSAFEIVARENPDLYDAYRANL